MSSEKENPNSQEEVAAEAVVEPAAEPSEAVEEAGEVSPEEMPAESTTVEELTRQLDEATKKADENWQRFLRTQAEMENLRRRTEKDLENAHKFALERFVKELLPVIDSLELGIQAAAGDNPDVVKLREGSELTLKQFKAVFDKFNIVTVDPVGEPFNPEVHQAMSMQPSAEAAPNTVLTVLQKGYLLNGRLLRPAMVMVAKAPE